MRKGRPKASAKKPGRIVWVIIHCEFFPRSEPPCSHPWIDEMVLHISGSLRAVVRYVENVHTSAWGWWKVEQRLVDESDHDADDRPVTYFFNFRGLPRKKPPHASARRAFDKWQVERAAVVRSSNHNDLLDKSCQTST